MRIRLAKTARTCLPLAKLGNGLVTDRAMLRSIGTLPIRDRCLLRLFLNRGASHGELAGILGMTRQGVAKTLRRLISTAADPRRLALVSAWHRFSPHEQRLAYLHLILEMPLHEISRLRLMRRAEADNHAGPAVSRTTLARLMRQIQRKVQRVATRAQRQAAATPFIPPDR